MLVAVYNPQYFSYELVTWFNCCTDSKNTEHSKLFTENKLQFPHIFYTTPESFTIFPEGNTFPKLLSDKIIS